mmetsp:Transcript_10589/g.38932  ORF Transcript_10589/g.38932 Transcript_10589/m.38932 type:complete len:201 (+) Transcript_10589:2063-2665(+)
MLFARLHSHAEDTITIGVLSNSDDTARHEALVLVTRCQKGRVGTTVAHGDTETLRRADGDVRSEFTRRLHQGESEQVARHNNLHLGSLCLLDGVGKVWNSSKCCRILHQHATDVIRRVILLKLLGLGDYDLEPKTVRACLAHFNRLREAVICNQEARLLPSCDRAAHSHGFSSSRGLVQKRCIGERKASQVGNHSLEVQE